MLQEDRYLKLIGYLKKQEVATLAELAEVTETSIGTVRRDLAELDKSGMLRVVRGGATIRNDDLTKQAFDMRSITNRQQKHELASLVGEVVVDGQAIALNSGTTNVEVAKFLVNNYYRLTVMTNNLLILDILKQAKNFTLIIPGGIYDEEEHTIYGKRCEEHIASYNIDTAIIAVNSISKEKGITDFRLREVSIIRALLKAAKTKVVAVDYTKFNRISCMNVCGFDEIDYIITDSITDEGVIQQYSSDTLKVLSPKR